MLIKDVGFTTVFYLVYSVCVWLKAFTAVVHRWRVCNGDLFWSLDLPAQCLLFDFTISIHF